MLPRTEGGLLSACQSLSRIFIFNLKKMRYIFNSATGIFGYFLVGRLDLPLIVLLSSGAVIGAFIRPKMIKKIDPKTLDKI
jgi:uncharacterized membrane protein YfcA